MKKRQNFRLLQALALSAAFSLLPNALAAQAQRSANLKTQKQSWRLVIGGSVSGTICDTSYGFAFLSDGRTICAISNSGRFLWQKGVKGAPSPYLSHMSDILLVVTAQDTLNLVNPSGLTLWSAKAGFEITENPLPGKDGRIFVRGKNAIACYNLQGKRKWLLRTNLLRTDLALTELDDGTLLVFLEETSNSKTQALHISPFGDILETATFSGFVHAAQSCADGVLVALSGGAGGLCAVADDGLVVSKWHLSGNGDCRQLAIFNDGKTGAFLSQTGAEARATIVDVKNGTKLSQLPLGKLSLSATNQLRTTNDGIYISDGSRAVEFAATGQNKDDSPVLLWEADLPPAASIAASFYTADGTLLICRNDWVINAYIMTQHVGQEPKKAPQPQASERTYQKKQTPSGTINNIAFVERIPLAQLTSMRRALSTGDYGAREQAWSANVQLEMQNWLYDMTQVSQSQFDTHSYFEDNPDYARAIVETGVAFGSADFAPLLASLLEKESRKPVCVDIIRAYAQLGWDEGGTMLTAIENVLQQHRFTARDTNALRVVCDTVYEICRYMGKPAIMAQGKSILAYLFYPQFDNTTRNYARKTFQRIAALELP